MRRDIADYEPNALQELTDLIQRLTLTDKEFESFKKSPFYKEENNYTYRKYNGETLCQLAKKYKISYHKLYYRIVVKGWSVTQALETV